MVLIFSLTNDFNNVAFEMLQSKAVKIKKRAYYKHLPARGVPDKAKVVFEGAAVVFKVVVVIVFAVFAVFVVVVVVIWEVVLFLPVAVDVAFVKVIVV